MREIEGEYVKGGGVEHEFVIDMMVGRCVLGR